MVRTALTDRKIQSLKAAETGKRYQVMDALVPGFGVRVTDRGVKTYIFQARFPGSANPARREINEATLEKAREKAREWSALVKRGVDPAQIKEQGRDQQAKFRANTFAAVVSDYFDRKLKKLRSGGNQRKRIELNLLPIFKNTPISEITDLDILGKLVNPRSVKTPEMARALFNDMNTFFGWVIDQRTYGLKLNPCDTIRISKIVGERPVRRRILNDDELRALWIAASRLPYPVGPLYRGLILTALRIRELSNTVRSEWKLHGNAWEWEIPASRMKGKLAHVVPVTADIREIYDACPKQGRFLFSFDGGETGMRIAGRVKDQIDAEMLKVLREIAVERGESPDDAELAHWVNHDIRRTVRSRLSRLKGIDLETREAILAHAKPSLQRVYDQYEYLDEKREALELWASVLKRIVEPPPSNVVPIREVA